MNSIEELKSLNKFKIVDAPIFRKKSKFVELVNALKVLDPTKAIELSIDSEEVNNNVNTFSQGLRTACKKNGFTCGILSQYNGKIIVTRRSL